MTEELLLLDIDEFFRRITPICDAMCVNGIDAALIGDNANLYYLTGRVFCGYVFLTADKNVIFAVKRPCHLTGGNVVPFYKVEELPQLVGMSSGRIALENGVTSFSLIERIRRAFGIAVEFADITPYMANARAVKTEFEIDKIKESAVKHKRLYSRIPHIFKPGMRDIDLQIEIERTARLEGSLGQFRVSGSDMELFMGNVLVGDNADAPSPYDFAMGGAGMDPSLPVGANGTPIDRGLSVMVDVNGNFTGYMTDMTRCFAIDGELPQRAMNAHKLSIDICHELQQMGHAGVAAADLYHHACEMAANAGFKDEFMGHRQHAGFVGHGLGIEINELPVLAPRSKSILAQGNIIAIEPKFVIPGVGAVGIENTYLVTECGPMQLITDFPEEIMAL